MNYDNVANERVIVAICKVWELRHVFRTLFSAPCFLPVNYAAGETTNNSSIVKFFRVLVSIPLWLAGEKVNGRLFAAGAKPQKE